MEKKNIKTVEKGQKTKNVSFDLDKKKILSLAGTALIVTSISIT